MIDIPQRYEDVKAQKGGFSPGRQHFFEKSPGKREIFRIYFFFKVKDKII